MDIINFKNIVDATITEKTNPNSISPEDVGSALKTLAELTKTNVESVGETTTTIKTKLGVASGSNDGYITKEMYTKFDNPAPGETTTSIKLKLGTSTSLTDGYLTSEDWVKFNAKVDKVNGTVPLAQLPPVYFNGLSGTGTQSDPYVFSGSGGGQASAEEYLKALPGYSSVEDRVLYATSGLFSWGAVPSGSLEKLETPVLTIESAAMDSFPLTWNAVINATSYVLQRDIDPSFATVLTVYTGANRQFTDINLNANTTYFYRLKANAAGFSGSNYGIASGKTLATGNITPPAPTNPITNDSTDIFDWTNSVGYGLISNYEYTLNAGATYTQATVKPLVIGNIAKAVGQVGIRVKADVGRNASGTLFNTVAFTVAPVKAPKPTLPVTDDTADTFDWTFSSGFTTISQYEYTLNGGTTYTQATEKPIYVGNVNLAVGQVGVRVKAATSVIASDTLFNTIAFTVPLPSTVPVTTWTQISGLIFTSGNTAVTADIGDGSPYGWCASTAKLPALGTGFVMFDNVATNASTTGGITIGLSTGTDKEGENGFNYRVYGLDGNRILGGEKGKYPISSAMPVSTNSKTRLRGDGVNIYTEYSINNGSTWTILNTGVQPNVELYVKLFADGNGKEIHNVVQNGLTIG